MIWIWIWFACPAFDNLPPPSGMILYVTVGLLAHPKAPPTMTFMKKSEQPTTEEGALSRNTVGLESCGKKERQNLGLNPIVSHCQANLKVLRLWPFARLFSKHCFSDWSPGIECGQPKSGPETQPSITAPRFRLRITHQGQVQSLDLNQVRKSQRQFPACRFSCSYLLSFCCRHHFVSRYTANGAINIYTLTGN